MKKIYLPLLTSLFFLLLAQLSFGQAASGWAVKYEAQKVFIENRGQFKVDAATGFDSKVIYAYDGTEQRYFLTRSGIVFELTDIKKPKEKEKEVREAKEHSQKALTPEDFEKKESEEKRLILTKDQLRAQWIGADPNVEIITDNKSSSYYSYCFNDDKGAPVNETLIPAFEKVTYKNLYHNIDVVYEIHPTGGIKYSVIVHPGGDISQVRLQYSKSAHLLANGTIKTKSRFGDFIDHAPVTFYEGDKTSIGSSYVLKNNAISFSVTNHDPSKTIVIDPWTQTPTFNTQWHCVWECQKDAANNVYVIGGVTPMQLLKYSPTGTLLWTYSTPWDTANYWLGTFAVDNAGNSYLTAGTKPEMQKVSTLGSLTLSNLTPFPGFIVTQELWSISFNCDQTQMVIGGTGSLVVPYIFNVDVSTLAVLNSVQVTGTGNFITAPQETRAITACGNGNYYYLTHDSIGYIHQSGSSCLPFGTSGFHTASGYHFSYGCENFRANNTGIKAIKSFGGYVYTHRGDQIDKRDFNTGAIIATAAIPGGGYVNTGFVGYYVTNSGIDIDSCGNVYVGSVNKVVKYNSNLVQLATYTTSSNFNVYDVQVSPNGNIIAAGSTGDNSSGARTGYVETFTASACANIAIVCCIASICPHAPVCTTNPPFNLTALTPGGVWSGTGITNTSTGTFSPAVTGVGTFKVYYTLPCGKDSTIITVNNCSATSVCRNANGTLTVSGGTAPYNWSKWDSISQTCVGGLGIVFGICTGTWVTNYGWANFATGATITPPVGVDSIKVVDNAATTIVILNPATVVLCVTCNMIVSAGTQTNVNCFGANTGVARTTVTGGSAPYSYVWSAGGSTLDSAVNLSAGTYTVTVHDVASCSGTATFTITQTAAAVSAIGVATPSTCGSNNGKVIFTVTGGTPAYTYLWSPNSSSTDSATGLGVGTYHITITDSKGCTFTTTSSVIATAGITVSAGTQKNVNCFGGNTGIAHVTVTGGTMPYTYTWSPNVSTVDSAVNLSAGTYSVTVHDINGCSGTASYTITQPATAVSATGVAIPSTCGNNNGKVIFTVTGGTPAYTYAWSPNSSTTDSATSLGVGTYHITITDSKGCTFTGASSVITTAGITVSAGTQKNVNCFGGNTGIAHVIVRGGTMPYSYAWSPNVSTVDSAVNLAVGTYTVTVHDVNGCSGTASFTITQPSAAIATTAVTSPSTCGSNNGKVIFTVTGGTPAYTYAWSPNSSTTDSATSLGVGTYHITITDNKGCTFTASSSVIATAGITVSAGTQKNVDCFGGNTGKAHVIVTGGTMPYSYAWSPNVSTVDSAVNLTAGTYSVTVHDVNGCSGTASFTITQPSSAIAATAVTSPSTCGSNNGKVIFTVSGGTPTYIYTWSPNVSTVDSAISLAVGNYDVTITDAKNCIFAASASVASSTGFAVTLGAKIDVKCFGGNTGSAHVTVTGGSGPYTYTWSPTVSTVDSAVGLTAGTYTVTARDANNCCGAITFIIGQPASGLSVTDATLPDYCSNSTGKVDITASGGTPSYTYFWSPNVSNNDSAINLAAGTYLVTVSDANLCIATISASVQTAPGATISLVSQQNVSCNGGNNGKIYVTATGGASPYRYMWSGVISTADSAVSLSQGNYSVTVYDANNCSSALAIMISQPVGMSVVVTTTFADCGINDGTATANVTGNAPGTISYQWSAGGSITSMVDTALAVGTYSVIVTDINHCTASASGNIINQSAPVATIANQVNERCNGDNTGKIILNVTGGSPTYTYLWSPNASTVDSAVNLISGTYNVTVRDASNCIAVLSTTITQPLSLSAGIQFANTDCGQSNGWAKISITGGIGAYTFIWRNITQSSDSITGLAPGSYYVTVTDSLGCQLTDSVLIGTNNGPVAPAISASGPVIFCQGASVVLTSSASTGNTWSTGATTQSITVSASGSYRVTQTVGGCVSPSSAIIAVIVNPIPPAPTISVSGPTSFCTGGSVTLTSSSLSGNLWSNKGTSQSITVPNAGTYTVSDTQAGCPSPASAPITVTIIPTPVILIHASKLSLCPGGSSVVLDATTPSATGYLWSNNSNQSLITINSPGSYQVSVTVNGCVGIDSIMITSEPLLGVLSLTDSFAICQGDSVTLDATTVNATSYIWTGLNATTPVVTVNTAGTYEVNVSNNCQSETATTIVTLRDCECKIVMPNAFTPNGDGKNEMIGPNFKCDNAKYLLMRIFNRWGEKVFETTDLTGQWDGKYKGDSQPAGVYVYYLEFVGLENKAEKSFKLLGSITLLR